MSTKNFFFLALLAVGTLMTYTACDSDPCADKDCGNGECIVDACECDLGWEYDNDGSCKVLKAGFQLDSATLTAVVKPGYSVDPATGNAVLLDGYEYNAACDCAVTVEKKFTGNYLVNETCSNSGTASPYNVSIAHGSSETDLKVFINGFYGPVASGGFIAQVEASINDKNITIARQEPDNDNIFVEGTGVIDTGVTPNKITITYKVTDETGATIVANQCNNVIFTKQ